MRTEAQLLAAARRAYERGRLGRAARQAAGLAPVAALAFLHCVPVAPTAVGITALVGLATLYAWLGRDWRRGLLAGLAAGLGPFVLPLLARPWTHACYEPVCLYIPGVCLAGGLLGGLVLGTTGLGRHEDPRAFGTAALSVTLVCGAVGCLFAGLGGLAGMGVGLTAGTLPALVLRRA